MARQAMSVDAGVEAVKSVAGVEGSLFGDGFRHAVTLAFAEWCLCAALDVVAGSPAPSKWKQYNTQSCELWARRRSVSCLTSEVVNGVAKKHNVWLPRELRRLLQSVGPQCLTAWVSATEPSCPDSWSGKWLWKSKVELGEGVSGVSEVREALACDPEDLATAVGSGATLETVAMLEEVFDPLQGSIRLLVEEEEDGRAVFAVVIVDRCPQRGEVWHGSEDCYSFTGHPTGHGPSSLVSLQ